MGAVGILSFFVAFRFSSLALEEHAGRFPFALLRWYAILRRITRFFSFCLPAPLLIYFPALMIFNDCYDCYDYTKTRSLSRHLPRPLPSGTLAVLAYPHPLPLSCSCFCSFYFFTMYLFPNLLVSHLLAGICLQGTLYVFLSHFFFVFSFYILRCAFSFLSFISLYLIRTISFCALPGCR